MEKTQLFLLEFGWGTLHSWKEVFMEPPPLSPPIFTHTSLLGIKPECHVSLFSLHTEMGATLLCTCVLGAGKCTCASTYTY